MGWLKRKLEGTTTGNTHDAALSQKHVAIMDHVEFADVELGNKHHISPYKLHPIELADLDLPFIPASTVQASKTNSNRLWLVIDTIVYDCTDFVDQHPGGKTVSDSFRGQDCTWQFWRFHNRAILNDGRSLRVGRTKDVPNRFPEQSRFVGLRRLPADED